MHKSMNHKKMFLLAAAWAFSAGVSPAFEVFSFSNLGGAEIQFDRSTSSFQFLNDSSTGNQWSITADSGAGTANNLHGWFSGGPWTVGTVNPGIVQTATVTLAPSASTSTMTIDDGNGHLATAQIAWLDITSFGGTIGMNDSLTVNLTHLFYDGLNPDLQSFFSAPAGELSLSFPANGPVTSLSQLMQGSGQYASAFNGVMNPVPEPSTLWLFGLGSLLFAGRAYLNRPRSA